jgi:hypothetical protein
MRFVELTASISGTLNDFTPEDIARALLASDLDVWVPEIQPALHKMQEIKLRMADRLAKADRADRLKARRLNVAGDHDPADHPVAELSSPATISVERGTWMTYAEAGSRFGISQDAIRHRASRGKWPRRLGDDGLVRVLVPDEAFPERPEDVHPDVHPDDARIGSPESPKVTPKSQPTGGSSGQARGKKPGQTSLKRRMAELAQEAMKDPACPSGRKKKKWVAENVHKTPEIAEAGYALGTVERYLRGMKGFDKS